MKLPQGFYSAGISVGIKPSSSVKDLGLIISDMPAQYAGVFTTNSVKAQCVIDSSVLYKSKKTIQALLVNSGNANACTGEAGVIAHNAVKSVLSTILNIAPDNILFHCTGVIGVPLPVEKIETNIINLKEKLSKNYKHFAESILTTDTDIKFYESSLGEASYITGIAKGSGMIHPNMATMLGYILIDANVKQAKLQKMLQQVVAKSFNQISVDGDMSTNDMVIALANGKSQEIINDDELYAKLEECCISLAKQIASDGEGASKLITTQVAGLSSEQECNKVAKGIISSNLVKTAIHGADPNWGRIIASLGQYTEININTISLYINNILIFHNGKIKQYIEQDLITNLKESKEVFINIECGNSKYVGRAWGCDLSSDYVKINAEYRT